MKTVYEAANAIEAHMLVDLLKQQGIEAHIHGELLQGAVGDLPAAGFVRVLVQEDDHAAARAIIDRWEAESAPPSPSRTPPSRGVAGFMLGLVVGIGVMYAAYRAPLATEGTDHNHDGVLDEKWTYSPNGHPLKLESDRNLDGKVDYITLFDANGSAESAESDDDFDGVFESNMRFLRGYVDLTLTDTDGDGFADLRTRSVNGVMSTTEYLNPHSGHPLRVEHFKLGILEYADLDTNKDGTLDTRQAYKPSGEAGSLVPLPK